MSLKNFIMNWIDSSKKAYKAWIETINDKDMGLHTFFWKCIKESSIWLYSVFIKGELDGILKQKHVDNVINKNSNEVAYLLWWYYLNPSTLLSIKTNLENKWVSTRIINKRYYSKQSLALTIRTLKNKIKQDVWKNIVLFWYSAWWNIVHRIWEQDWYKSVSFGTSEQPEKTIVGALLSLRKNKKMKCLLIPKNWVNIIETFSGMVPHTWENKENTIKLNDVYSHMTIWKKEVIEEVVKQILLWFEQNK